MVSKLENFKFSNYNNGLRLGVGGSGKIIYSSHVSSIRKKFVKRKFYVLILFSWLRSRKNFYKIINEILTQQFAIGRKSFFTMLVLIDIKR